MEFLEDTKATINMTKKTLTLQKHLTITFNHQAKKHKPDKPAYKTNQQKGKQRQTTNLMPCGNCRRPILPANFDEIYLRSEILRTPEETVTKKKINKFKQSPFAGLAASS